MSLPNTIVQKGRFVQLLTKNLTPGRTFFEQETLQKVNGAEYREFSSRNSKLAAAVAKGCSELGISEGSTILYLGASHGYTCSFVSDIVGKKGLIYAIEFSPVVARDLVFVAEARENIIPILADASKMDEYTWRVTGADVVFQDIAQREQVKIFLDNCRMFLKPGGYGLLALKARSIDATREPKDIFRQMKGQLNNTAGFKLVDNKDLTPYEKDHMFFVIKKS